MPLYSSEWWIRGIEVSIEVWSEYWEGFDVEVEESRFYYIGSETVVDILKSEWIGSSVNIEGVFENWVDLLCRIVYSSVDNWVENSVNVEATGLWWIGQGVDVEEYRFYYVGSSIIVDIERSVWLSGNINVEGFVNKYVNGVVNAEEYYNRYVKSNSIVEDVLYMWYDSEIEVEGFLNEYCGMFMVVLPAVKFVPEPGIYKQYVDVVVDTEIPAIVKYTIDGSEPELNGVDYGSGEVIRFRKTKELKVVADYLGGYKVRKSGIYEIVDSYGKSVATFGDVDIFIENPEILWKEV